MSLNQQQERYISNYLRDVALRIDPGVQPSRAQRALDLLDARIRRDIEGKTNGSVQDADVVRVLDELGPPETHAEQIRPDNAAQDGRAPAVWLGVCSHWASKVDVPVRLLRIGVFVAGLVTGPLALWAYVAAFAHLYVTTPKEKRPAIDYVRIAWNVGSCIAIITVLSWVLDYALWGIAFGHERLFDKDLPSAGGWGWIKMEAPGYYSLTLMTTLPLALIAGLPVAGGHQPQAPLPRHHHPLRHLPLLRPRVTHCRAGNRAGQPIRRREPYGLPANAVRVLQQSTRSQAAVSLG
jgi:phage shock protein PspC (stress-responsive transcriptional regulator)